MNDSSEIGAGFQRPVSKEFPATGVESVPEIKEALDAIPA